MSDRTTLVPPSRWPWALIAYATSAVLIALLLAVAENALAARGVKGPWAMVITVNIIFPLSIMLVSAWYPRPRMVWAGCFIAILFFTAGRGLTQNWRFWTWTLPQFAHTIHPVVVAGAAFATFCGFAIVRVIRPWRTVGIRPDPTLCKSCGYSLTGLDEAPCPECGAPGPRIDA